MKIIELLLDEENEISGVDAVSLVSMPAIESSWVALKDQEIKLAKVDEEKRIVMGAALIPNKPIFRRSGEETYYVYFSKDTIRRASELFFQKGNQSNATLEHELKANNLTVFESWIVEDSEKDKSAIYNLDAPVGSWVISMKIEDDKVWESVKNGLYTGYSIEGYFADKATLSHSQDFKEVEAQTKLDEILNLLNSEEVELESYNDYPEAVSNNAKKGIELNEKNGNKCATNTGKIRATQLRDKKNVSLSTIKRMYSYLSRAAEYYDEGNNEACGTISYLLWGGKSALSWSKNKLKELGEIDLKSMVIDENYAVIDDRLAYSTKEMALEISKTIGCDGFHIHNFEGKDWFMPCEGHEVEAKKTKSPCWDGYRQKGWQTINGKRRPNCVKIK